MARSTRPATALVPEASDAEPAPALEERRAFLATAPILHDGAAFAEGDRLWLTEAQFASLRTAGGVDSTAGWLDGERADESQPDEDG